VGITAGSREVPGRKGLWQETMMIMMIIIITYSELGAVRALDNIGVGAAPGVLVIDIVGLQAVGH